MLRDFPSGLQRFGDAIIPPRASASPVSPAWYYQQHYVRTTTAAISFIKINIINRCSSYKTSLKQLFIKVNTLLFQLRPQFQTTAGSYSDTRPKKGASEEKKVQVQAPAAVLPVYMTQDHVTLVVLTLLLGGWLAFAFTYPIVSLCG